MEKTTLVWDTCKIAEEEAAYLVNSAKEEGRELDEGAAFSMACEDSDLYQCAWDDLCECLTDVMKSVAPDEDRWHCEVKHFGWRGLNGYKDFKAKNGKELLSAVLPKTDCTFKIYVEDDHIRISNAHHDSPTGAETYIVESGKRWVIKSLYDSDDNGDMLLWSEKEKTFVSRDSNDVTIYRDRAKKKTAIPRGEKLLSSRDDSATYCELGEIGRAHV